MSLIEFVKQFAVRENCNAYVLLEWYWKKDDFVLDKGCSFWGTANEFINKVSMLYENFEVFDVFNVYGLKVINEDNITKIYIDIVQESLD